MKKMKLNIQMFGHTNETTNYDLPQFVGTDKPTWLGDFNSAMSAIDTAIAGNASDITSLGTRVTSAEGVASQASSDVASLTSTVSTLSSNVSSIATTANNAQSTATTALNTANSAQSTATSADGKADTNASAITALDGRVEDLEPVTLFNDASGSQSITLSASASNYNYLEIFYGWGDGTSFGVKSCRVYDPNNKKVNLDITALNNNMIYIATSLYTISGTSISGTGEQWRFGTSGSPTRTQTNQINIYRVLGYTTENINAGS